MNDFLALVAQNPILGIYVVAIVTSVILIVGGYFLPWFVAWRRHHPDTVMIFLVNTLLGWSVLGWVGSLVWALSTPRPPTGMCPVCNRVR